MVVGHGLVAHDHGNAHACMKHRARADSISSSGEYFIDFHSLEKGQHWMELNSFSFSHLCLMWKLGVAPNVPGQHMFQYVLELLLTHLILSLLVNDFDFLLSNCTLCYEITVILLCEFVYNSNYIIHAYG